MAQIHSLDQEFATSNVEEHKAHPSEKVASPRTRLQLVHSHGGAPFTIISNRPVQHLLCTEHGLGPADATQACASFKAP